MKITLICEGERAEIEGDDDLIANDLCYQGAFHRQVKQVTELFYKDVADRTKGGGDE